MERPARPARDGEAHAEGVPDLDGGEFSAWTGITSDEFRQVIFFVRNGLSASDFLQCRLICWG